MVAAGPISAFSIPFTAGLNGGGSDSANEVARIKAEILSARSEKQCATCDGDKEKLDEKIRELEARLRRVQSVSATPDPKNVENRKPDVSTPERGEETNLALVNSTQGTYQPGRIVDIRA